MKIMIIGAGQVGKSVMDDLLQDHSISMVDQNSDNLDNIPFDVEVTAGSGLEREILEEAGLNETDLVIATTSDDQTNLLICNMVKVLTESYTIARVSDPSFTETWETAQGAFGVDALIGRADLTANQINDLIGLQASAQEALNEQTFCQGHVKMSEFELTDESPLTDRTISNTDDYENVTFGSIYRDGEFLIAKGDVTFEEGDRLVVFGSPEHVDEFGIEIAQTEQNPVQNTVDILGGGDIGFLTASMLEDTSLSVRIFEKNPERAQFLSEHLTEALVLEADITQRIIWEEENLNESEMTIICTGNDERNALTTLLGQDFDAPRLVSVVHEEQYLSLFELLGITQVLHPREVVASSITDYVKESYAQNVTMLEHESGEVFEYQIEDDSPVSGMTIEELDDYLDQEFVVGAIVRRNRTIHPKGSVTIETGDRLIFLTTSDQAETIADEL
jgi:trk system potassium uptake protein TrkA